MKIICDNCRTKYSIADEKVRGKVFKIRCKKCQNIIVVRGTQQEDSAPQQPQDPDFGADAHGDTPVWHMVIDREQVGPMTAADVRDRYAKGDVNEETYIWREGMGSWQRLGSTEEFAEMSQATKVASPSMIAPESEPVDPGFGGEDPVSQWGQAQAADQEPAWGGQDAAAPAEPAWGAEPAQEAAAPADPAWGAEPEQPVAAPADPAWGAEPEQPAQEQPGDDPAQLAYSTLAEDQQRDLFATYHGDDGLLPVQPGAGTDMFGADSQDQPPSDVVIHPGQDADGQGMTGARNENSVLFSLSNLQDLAMGKSSEPVSVGDTPPVVDASNGGDGSGLIDIRAMANLTAPSAISDGDSGFDDMPSLGNFSSPVTAAPVLMPTVEDEKPKWVLPLVIGMGCVLVGLVGLVVYLAAFKTTPTPLTTVADNSTTNPASSSDDDSDEDETKKAVASKDETKKAEEPATKAATEASTDKAAPEAKTALASDSTAAKPRSSTKRRKGRRGGRKRGTSRPSTRSSRGGSSALPAPAPRRSTTRRRGARKKDSLDDLIDGALTGSKKRRPRKKAPAAPDENLPESLTKSQIQGGMRKTKNRVQACYDRFKVPGLARVSITIGRKGRVTSAKVKGVFAGTPTGDCVKKATKGARFPKFKGSPITITYPFILR